jgi:hypothetical protein
MRVSSRASASCVCRRPWPPHPSCANTLPSVPCSWTLRFGRLCVRRCRSINTVRTTSFTTSMPYSSTCAQREPHTSSEMHNHMISWAHHSRCMHSLVSAPWTRRSTCRKRCACVPLSMTTLFWPLGVSCSSVTESLALLANEDGVGPNVTTCLRRTCSTPNFVTITLSMASQCRRGGPRRRFASQGYTARIPLLRISTGRLFSGCLPLTRACNPSICSKRRTRKLVSCGDSMGASLRMTPFIWPFAARRRCAIWSVSGAAPARTRPACSYAIRRPQHCQCMAYICIA